MTDLKVIPLHEFMNMPLEKKFDFMYQAFSKVKNPLMQFQNWRAALQGWNVRPQQITEQLEIFSKQRPDEPIWDTYSALMVLDSSYFNVSSSEATQKLTLARNNSPEKIAIIVELDYAAKNRYAIQVAETILEINDNMRQSGLSIVDFSTRMVDMIGECRWVDSLVGWSVSKDSLVGFFQRRVSWDYYKNPEGLYALATLSKYVLDESKKETQ